MKSTREIRVFAPILLTILATFSCASASVHQSKEISRNDINYSEICGQLLYLEDSLCINLLRKIYLENDFGNEGLNLESLDAGELVIYLKDKSEAVQGFLLRLVMSNWNFVNGTEVSLSKLEILLELQRKKEYGEKIAKLTQSVENGEILKLLFASTESKIDLSEVTLSPSAYVKAIRHQLDNNAQSIASLFNIGDGDFPVQDLLNSLRQKDVSSLDIIGSLLSTVLNITTDEMKANAIPFLEDFMATSTGILRPVSGGISEEFRMYTLMLTNTLKEVQKGNFTALGHHIKNMFHYISIGTPGNFSELVGLQAGPQVQAFAVGLDILIGIIDGISKAADVVDKIDSFIPLTFGEKFEEGIRAFLRYQPSQDIQILAGTKTGNHELVQYATNFLEENENVQSIVLPSVLYTQSNCRKDITVKCLLLIFGLFCDKKCDQNFGLHANSVVRLDDMYEVYLDRSRPDRVADGYEIFCSPGSREETSLSESKVTAGRFLCENAFGVRTEDQESDGINIVSLGDGVDEAFGLGNTSNLFLVGSGHKVYIGGNQSDTFVLSGGDFSGSLDGNGNLNTLLIPDQFGSEKVETIVDLKNGKFRRVESEKKRTSSRSADLHNIQSVIGRKRRGDHVMVNCDTVFVNGRGGQEKGFDKIEIYQGNCTTEMSLHVKINNFTLLENEAIRGKFIYDITFNSEQVFQISEESLAKAEHIFNFDYALSNISSINFNNASNEVLITEITGRILRYPVGSSPSPDLKLFRRMPKFFTKTQGSNEVEAEIRISAAGRAVIVHPLNSKRKSTRRRIGFPGLKNIFVFQSGFWNVSGNGKENIFILENEEVSGILEGIPGNRNVLVLGKLNGTKMAKVDLNAGLALAKNTSIKNVESIVGREFAQDKIIAACNTEFISGRQGFSELEPDFIQIPDLPTCNFNLRVIVEDAMVVENDAKKGRFYYEIRTRESSLDLGINAVGAEHYFLLQIGIDVITNLTFVASDHSLLYIGFQSDQPETQYIIPMQPLPHLAEFYSQPRIMTNDGVEIKVSANGTVVALVQNPQKPKFRGFTFVKNIFYLANNSTDIPGQELVGGDLDDVFILVGNELNSRDLDGGLGHNTIIAKGSNISSLGLKFDLKVGRINSIGNTNDFLILRNFAIARGRLDDEVIASCDTNYVGGFGRILIPENRTCNYSLTVELSSTTNLTNNAKQGNFIYKFMEARSFHFENQDLNQTYILSMDLKELEALTYDSSENKLRYQFRGQTFDLHIGNMDSRDLFHNNPRIFTADKAELRVSRWGGVQVSKISDESLPEILTLYPTVANRLNVTVALEAKTQSILIGGNGGSNVFQNRVNIQSHLIGQGSQNMFRIVPTTEDVFIHLLLPSGNQNMLDLSEVVVPIREKTGTMYTPTIREDKEDIILEFPLFKLVVVGGLTFRQNLKVVLDVSTMDIESDNEVTRMKRSLATPKSSLKLKQSPLIIEESTRIVILTPGDLEPNTEIQMTNSQTSSSSFESIRMGDSVIVTNLGRKGSFEDSVTIVLTEAAVNSNSHPENTHFVINFPRDNSRYEVRKDELHGTLSQLQTQLKDQAYQEIYGDSAKVNLPIILILVLGAIGLTALVLIFATGLAAWKKRNSGSYIVNLIGGLCNRSGGNKPKPSL